MLLYGLAVIVLEPPSPPAPPSILPPFYLPICQGYWVEFDGRGQFYSSNKKFIQSLNIILFRVCPVLSPLFPGC